MSNSKLVDYTKLSPNSSNPRKKPITVITIHHVAGNASVETLGDIFAQETRQASSNYGIGTDARVGMYVEEKNRAWTSGNAENDNQAITIEVANDGGAPDWHVSDKALAKLIDLCIDICKRNKITKINYTGDKNGNLTMHKWFQATACPGPYLESKFNYIADEINKVLIPAPKPQPVGKTYTVKKGDSFWSIAQAQLKNGSRYKEIVKLNGLTDKSVIHAGQVIKIPFDGLTMPVNHKPFKYGDKVRVISGARDYSGGGLAKHVYSTLYTVLGVNNNRVVIGLDDHITAAVQANDLYKS